MLYFKLLQPFTAVIFHNNLTTCMETLMRGPNSAGQNVMGLFPMRGKLFPGRAMAHDGHAY